MSKTKELEKMVKEQIISRGIKDKKVLSAMCKVPRDELVPEDQKEYAFEDRPLPIGEGQTISQPYIVAYMTELLKLKGNEKVLEIGAGSGYQAAILAEIGCEVYTVEIIEVLAKRAEENLKKLGYENIKIKVGDGFFGWPEYAPFDRIIITCATPAIPPPLIDQLKNNGRIVAPIGRETSYQILTTIDKKHGKVKHKEITSVVFVPMTGKEIEEFKKKMNCSTNKSAS